MSRSSEFATVPLTLVQANELVSTLHRHHKPVTGHRFSIGAVYSGELVGCCIVGRLVARAVDPFVIAEVNRLATNGQPNACSFLYAAATKICREMGFSELWTYILESEPGSSLSALKQLGWINDGVVRSDGKGWTSRDNRFENEITREAKQRWRVIFRQDFARPCLASDLDLLTNG